MKLIRVDFSSEIGFGHLKRQEAFIKWKMENEKWKINEVVIVCKECEQKYTDIPIIKIKDENEFFELVKKLKPDEVIVDNYNFTYENEKEFKELFPKIKLTCFDDLFYKHYCEEVININPYAKKKDYFGKVPYFTNIKLLKPFIREEFKKAKKMKFKKEGIFISFGGTDAKGIGLKVLKQLQMQNGKWKIDVYTTSANKNLDNLKRFCRINKWCKLHIDEDVAIGMAKAKFAIITPSTITWEAMYMKLPFIAVKVAENQKLISKYLIQKRIKVLKQNEIQKISRFIP